MRHRWIVSTALTLALAASPGSADLGRLIVGGGEGRLGSDVDNDGDLDGSYFGIGVVQQDEATSGHFIYGMWGNTDVMELPLLALEGQITGSEAVAGSDDLLFSGSGTVDLGDGVAIRDLPFDVLVTPGGPDHGSMQLTLYGAFDGQLGDMVPGNGDCEMPPQTVSSGQISSRPLADDVVIPEGPRMIGGGGLTSFGMDLDDDGDIDGAYFGLGINLLDEGADGHFVCAMWGDVEYWGLRLMAIEGRIDSVTFDDEDPRKFNFFGRGTVDLGMGSDGFFTDIAFDVQARTGGPTDGYLRLTIHGVLDGVPGDRIHENGDCDLPIEWVDSGIIAMQLEAPSIIPTTVETVNDDAPDHFALVQNYPNPFNSSTVINFSLTESAPTELFIYNTAQQKVATLIDGPRAAGSYSLPWDGKDDDGRDLATGTYLLSLRSGGHVRQGKLLLVR